MDMGRIQSNCHLIIDEAGRRLGMPARSGPARPDSVEGRSTYLNGQIMGISAVHTIHSSKTSGMPHLT
jgi:hypothetical protein